MQSCRDKRNRDGDIGEDGGGDLVAAASMVLGSLFHGEADDPADSDGEVADVEGEIDLQERVDSAGEHGSYETEEESPGIGRVGVGWNEGLGVGGAVGACEVGADAVVVGGEGAMAVGAGVGRGGRLRSGRGRSSGVEGWWTWGLKAE